MFNVFENRDEQVVEVDFGATESSSEEYQDFTHASYSEHIGHQLLAVRNDIEDSGAVPVTDGALSDLRNWLNRNKNSPEAATYKTNNVYVAFGGGHSPTNHVSCMVWKNGSFVLSTTETWAAWTSRHIALID